MNAFLKKNWYLLTPALIIIIPLLMMLYCNLIYGYSMTESATVVRHFGSTSTRYGQGFSEGKFKLVKTRTGATACRPAEHSTTTRGPSSWHPTPKESQG